LLEKNRDPGWEFVAGQRPKANSKGRIPTTMEWAKKLTAQDIDILKGAAPYSDKAAKRNAPEADIKALQELLGHLQVGLFITKFRKIFRRDEMNDDLLIVPAWLGNQEDSSEYEEILPSSPP
jgi:hypothetical protein